MTRELDSPVLGRRGFLKNASGTAAAAGLAAALGAQSPTSAMAAAAPSLLGSNCVLTPAAASGPFYTSLGLNRRDISEGQPGLRMTLLFKVVRASDCSPVPNAFVDLWHNNAEGTYSAFSQQGTLGETWLRGAQGTNSRGFALFETIYPGWYPGRTCHFHIKVFHGPSVFTTQLYLPDGFTEKVWKQAPYAANGPNPTNNGNDAFFLPETMIRVRPIGLSAFPFAGGMRHVLGAKTIVLA